MWLIIIDLLYLVAYFWLVKRLFKLTPTQIGYYQQKYLTFSVLYLGQWFIVGFLLIGLNVLKFFPQFRQEFSFPLGILGMLMSIPVRIKAGGSKRKLPNAKLNHQKMLKRYLNHFVKYIRYIAMKNTQIRPRLRLKPYITLCFSWERCFLDQFY
ncbi:hypothetical protein [Lactobacillus xujianguonis]|uniref:hypothetical protein n=1 Tax=Lactobacillus xujianguonis TaxID=2495899 RepID=UPI000FD8F865|nr:hypothetical protein [Lactobacillus xujianguonis]RVU73948.1 hypothetical protein EJK20_05245 [Lactobacillus xujianguonis]